MNRRKFLRKLAASGMMVVAFRFTPLGSSYVLAKDGPNPLKRRVTHADRKAAAANRANMGITATAPTLVAGSNGALIPDYFGTTSNYANSPMPILDPNTKAVISGGIRKFVDSLPGLGPSGANKRLVGSGEYIPVAVPDKTTYPGSDYYEIGLVEYTQKFHSDLKPTKLRGYVQLNDPAHPATRDPLTGKIAGWPQPHYLGPVIVAQRDVPVRVKFSNLLPTGANGNLFIPVDTTVMGAGMGPDAAHSYSQNRATVHLHGGNTPWISDGTAHQWTTPAGEITPWPKGVSVQNVPDMPAAGNGELTFFYTNQQSARLMFYHDHAYGITRLNVYAGEAAGYVLTDPAERQLVSGGLIPADTERIPLIIQDKTFIDPGTLNAQDPTWPFVADFTSTTTNNLWYPHVYMPNQNPYDMTGSNAMGRWDYGPWFWPPFTGITNGPVANPYASNIGEPPIIPGTPNLSIVPEAFMDTPVVNGQVYPYLEVDPKAYRFLVLNACNDRTLNLQLYLAKAQGVDMWDANGNLINGDAGEVNMVPAVPGNWPSGWPITPDGRDGGFPDPTAADPTIVPNMIQIGTEGGLLPAPVVIPNRPIGYDYNRRSVTVLNVLETALFLGPAERADVIVDFSKCAGKTLILYNDAPAPVPAFDPRYDYYTNDPDNTLTGGAPSTVPGYGPNTRTIMQIRVKSLTPAPAFNLAALQAALPAAFAASQDKIIVPNTVYDAVYGTTLPADSYVRIQDTSLKFINGPLQGVTLTNGGGGYTTAPAVSFNGGGGSGATATATLTPTSLASVTLSNTGTGYTTPPTVSFSGTGGATATAKLAATSVATITVTNGGKGYRTAPTVVIAGGGSPNPTILATATATITSKGAVSSVTVVNHGSGYVTAPTISFSGGGGSGATATASLTPSSVASVTLVNKGSGYTSAPLVTISGGGGSGATAYASLTPTSVASVTLTNGGSNYLAAPTVSFNGGAGSGATAVATGLTMELQPKAIQELFDPHYGRMNAILGCEIPNTTGNNQTTIPYYFIDPPNEIIRNSDIAQPIGSASDGTQIWKITHNGVDTHAIHFHLFNVQVLNRVGWDGAIKPPDANELGWKDTVRMNPLEDAIVALRPYKQNIPWDLPNSIRPLDVTMAIGSTMDFTNVDPTGQPANVTNALVNFGWEYTWHCHLLGHEENDMMRPMIFAVTPKAPTGLTAAVVSGKVVLNWTNNARNVTSFTVQRATAATGPWSNVGTVKGTTLTTPVPTTFSDGTVAKKKQYWYRVIANNVVGYTQTYAAPAIGYPNTSMDSAPSDPPVTITT